MDQFTREFAANRQQNYATGLFPYFTKTWKAPRCLAKTFPLLFTPKANTTTTTTSAKATITTTTLAKNNNNNIVSSLAQYSSWIINLYFKVIQVLFLFCLGNYLRGTRTASKLYSILSTHLAISPTDSISIFYRLPVKVEVYLLVWNWSWVGLVLWVFINFLVC